MWLLCYKVLWGVDSVGLRFDWWCMIALVVILGLDFLGVLGVVCGVCVVSADAASRGSYIGVSWF